MKIFDWISKNRNTVVIPVVLLLAIGVMGACVPATESPLTGEKVTITELERDYKTVLAGFEAAAVDLEQQYAQRQEVTKIISAVASGQVTTVPGVISLLLGGGLLGVGIDNRRKDTVIKAMKRGSQISTDT